MKSDDLRRDKEGQGLAGRLGSVSRRSDAPASSLARMLCVLDLFSREATALSADEIAAELGLARTTCYRYIRELMRAGLLVSDAGLYGLGPRIIQLDQRIRQADPLLNAGQPVLARLVERTGAVGVLATLSNGQIIHIHQEGGQESSLAYSRGTTVPIFRSATSKVILANLKPARLKRLWDAHRESADVCAIGAGWDAFLSHMQAIRRQGYWVSHGELTPSVVGIAAPVLRADGAVLGSVALVFQTLNFELFAEPALGALLIQAAADIRQGLGRSEPVLTLAWQAEAASSGI